jgi:hypothetical protein
LKRRNYVVTFPKPIKQEANLEMHAPKEKRGIDKRK